MSRGGGRGIGGQITGCGLGKSMGTSRLDNIVHDRNRCDILFNKVISTKPILDKIVSYLSLTEQKQLLICSKFLAKAIRETKSFQESSKLLICEKSYSEGVFNSCMSFEWKSVSIELEKLPLEALDIIKCLVCRAETLEFHLLNGYNQEMINISVTHCMTEIMAAAHKMTSLKIDCALMEKELKCVLTDMRVQITLRNLEHLKFVNPFVAADSVGRLQDFEVLSKESKMKMYTIQGTYGLWSRNFTHLLGIPMDLKTLHVDKIRSPKKNHIRVLNTMVNENTISLIDLAISADMWSEGINNFKFPSLKSVKLRAHQTDENLVRKFLMGQGELESMDVGFVDAFPLSVLTLIQAKASATKLKTLRLKCKYFVDSLDPINWMFLKSLQTMEEFHLRMATYVPTSTNPTVLISPTDFISVVSNLPKSIKRIKLSGLRRKINTDTFHSLIENYRQLTDIDVMQCPEVIDDALLQLLISKNTQLQKLKFSHCSNVTAFGFTGIADAGNNSGYALRHLTALRELAMRHCAGVKLANIVDELRFKHLRQLDIFTYERVSEKMMVEVIKNNPSLETLSVNISSEDFKELPLIIHRNVRISQIIRLMEPDFASGSYYEDDSSEDDEVKEKSSVSGVLDAEEPAFEATAKSIAAKKMAARFADLNFDEEDVCEDLSRFDSDDDDFDGLDYIPG